MILPIVKHPDRILRARAAAIPLHDITSEKIKTLIKDMKETLKNTPDGVGLAAPQIGESLQLFIVSEEAEEIDKAEKKRWKKEGEDWERLDSPPYEPREWQYYVFINPSIKKTGKQKLMAPEGCLSVPKKYGVVARIRQISIEAYNETGKKFTRGESRFFARVMQHELDHLSGTLFIDKVEEWLDADEREERRKHKG